MRNQLLAIFGFSLLTGFALAQSPETQPAPVFSSQDQIELQTLTRQLMDPDRAVQTKFEAASLLLAKPYPEATKALEGLLADKSNRSARLAIAKAMSSTGLGKPEFADPLFDMLGDPDPATREAAAGAMTSCKAAWVLDRLARLVNDGRTEETVRLSGIAALSRILDKRSVDTLITLLEAGETNLRAPSAEALAKLTGIPGFGADAVRWRGWWVQNKDKSRQDWLADLSISLTRQNAALEGDAGKLRARLGAALTDLYNTTAAADREALLLGFLKDPLDDVRLIGLQLTTRLASTDPPAAGKMSGLVRMLLNDEDAQIRSASAALIPMLNDPQASQVLMRQLEAESVDAVRRALITALGTLRVPEATDLLLRALADESNATAMAAAVAIERLAEKAPLPDARVQQAVEAITTRYNKCEPSQSDLREALLGAMGVLGRAEFSPVMCQALEDKVATIRLAAVRGLQQMNSPASAKVIAPLVSRDPDRGVRQAAITALGALGSLDHLDTILDRTRDESEKDLAVRQRAWETVLTLLSKAELEDIEMRSSALADRADARDYRIRMLAMMVARLADKPDRQIEVQTEMAETLLSAGRPAEAAQQFALVNKALASDPKRAGEVWIPWISSLLAADDGSALAFMADQADKGMFDQAVYLLMKRLATLQSAGKYETIQTLAEQVPVRLKDKLPPERLQDVQLALKEARDQQFKADRARVGHLVLQLSTGDDLASKAARTELDGMGKRAVPLLVEHMRTSVTTQPATANSPTVEKTIVQLLAKLAPDLTGYDPTAAPPDKAKTLDRWMKELGT